MEDRKNNELIKRLLEAEDFLSEEVEEIKEDTGNKDKGGVKPPTPKKEDYPPTSAVKSVKKEENLNSLEALKNLSPDVTEEDDKKSEAPSIEENNFSNNPEKLQNYSSPTKVHDLSNEEGNSEQDSIPARKDFKPLKGQYRDFIKEAKDSDVSRFVDKVPYLSKKGEEDTGSKKNSALEGVENVKESINKARDFFVKTKAIISSSVALLTNPVTLITTAIALIIFAIVLSGATFINTFGQVEKTLTCSTVFSADDAKELHKKTESERAKLVGAWLLSRKFSFLKGKPMSVSQASGVLGNFSLESGLIPLRVEGLDPEESLKYEDNLKIKKHIENRTVGIGLAQWTGVRAEKLIEYAESKKSKWSSLEIQLSFLKDELESHYGELLNKKGFDKEGIAPEDAGVIFHEVFEASADGGDGIKRRADKSADFSKIIVAKNEKGGCKKQGSGGFSENWGYPLKNEAPVTSPFGPRLLFGMNFHYGIDLGAPCGEEVLATNGGEVVRAGYYPTTGEGNGVIIKHDQGGETIYTWYMHMLDGSLKVSEGDTLDKGDIIGLVGSTGNSTACHLHYQVNLDSMFDGAVDPAPDYIGKPEE